MGSLLGLSEDQDFETKFWCLGRWANHLYHSTDDTAQINSALDRRGTTWLTFLRCIARRPADVLDHLFGWRFLCSGFPSHLRSLEGYDEPQILPLSEADFVSLALTLDSRQSDLGVPIGQT